MNAEEKIFFHALQNVCNARFDLMEKLRHRFGEWESAWNASTGALAQVLSPRSAEALSNAREKFDARAEWQKFEKSDIVLLLAEDEQYPPRLKEIPYAPYGVYVRGAFEDFTKTHLAIVGTRACSPYGRIIAEKIAYDLACSGAVVVSGLAFGIDAAAHRGCLKAGGRTIAVLASGLDHVYPASNSGLADEILASGGMLVSEYPPGMTPMKHRFLERNRIVSGLSSGITVIEAPARSGSLATARFAIDQNRDVFVVPGQVTAKSFAGSHALIKQGAQMITEAADIIAQYDDLAQKSPANIEPAFTSPEEEKIFRYISKSASPVSAEELIAELSFEAGEINTHLTMLVMSGILKESGGLFHS